MEFNFKKIIIHLLLAMDSILFINMAYTAIQSGIFFTILGSINSLLQNRIVGQLNRKLSRIVTICRLINEKSNDQIVMSKRLLEKIDKIYYRHSLACNDNIFSYNVLWGNALLCYLLISIPFNVICVSALLVKDLNWLHIIMTQTAIVLHSIITLGLLFRLAKLTKVLNEAKYYLIPIIQSINCIKIQNDQQQKIDFYALKSKLKIEDKFQRLTWGPKYGPFVSILGSITNALIFNVSEFFSFQLNKFFEFFFSNKILACINICCCIHLHFNTLCLNFWKPRNKN